MKLIQIHTSGEYVNPNEIAYIRQGEGYSGVRKIHVQMKGEQYFTDVRTLGMFAEVWAEALQ